MDNKETQKVPIFLKKPSKLAKIGQYFSIKYNKLKNSENTQAISSFLLEILGLGLLTNLTVIPFGIGFTAINILCFGSGFWLIKEKIIPILVQIKSS